MQVVYHKEQGVRAYALRALVRDPSSGHWNGRALLAVRGSALGEITTLVNDAMDFIVDEALLERMPIALGFFFENMQKLNDQALIQNDSIRHMHAYGRMLGADICNLYSLSDDGRRIPYMEARKSFWMPTSIGMTTRAAQAYWKAPKHATGRSKTITRTKNTLTTGFESTSHLPFSKQTKSSLTAKPSMCWSPFVSGPTGANPSNVAPSSVAVYACRYQ